MITGFFKRFSAVTIFNIAMLGFCWEAEATDYTLTWLPAESTYNGKPFADLGNGSGSTDPADDNPDRAYAEVLFNGIDPENLGRFLYFRGDPVQDYSFGERELGATPLQVGTDLVLVFQMTNLAGIASIYMSSDNVGDFSYRKLSDTKFEIHGKVMDPIPGASTPGTTPSDDSAAFSLYFDMAYDFFGYTQVAEPSPFIFLTNNSSSSGSNIQKYGVLSTNVGGDGDPATQLYVLVPYSNLTLLGIDDSNVTTKLKLYRGTQAGERVTLAVEPDTVYIGKRTDLGCDFGREDNPDNAVYVLGLTVTEFTDFGRKIGAGHVDTRGPKLNIHLKTFRATKSSITIKGKFKDDSQLSKISGRSSQRKPGDELGSFQKRYTAKENGDVTFKIKHLVRGTNSISLEFNDAFGNGYEGGFYVKY